MENTVQNVEDIRLLDNVAQYFHKNTWKPFVNSVINKEGTFKVENYYTGKYIRINSDSDVTLVIEDKNFNIGATLTIRQVGTGAITLSSNTYTLNGELSTLAQYAVIQAIKVSNTEWDVIGGTTL